MTTATIYTYLQDLEMEDRKQLYAQSNNIFKKFQGYQLFQYTDGSFGLRRRESGTMYIVLGSVYKEYEVYSNEFDTGIGYKQYPQDHTAFNMLSEDHYVAPGITASVLNSVVGNIWESGHRLAIYDLHSEKEYYFPLAPREVVLNKWIGQSQYLATQYDNIHNPIFRILAANNAKTQLVSTAYNPFRDIMLDIMQDRKLTQLEAEYTLKQQQIKELLIVEDLDTIDLGFMPGYQAPEQPIIDVHLSWTEDRRAYISMYKDYTWDSDHRKDVTHYITLDTDIMETKACNAWLAKHGLLEVPDEDLRDSQLAELEKLEHDWNKLIRQHGLSEAYEMFSYNSPSYERMYELRSILGTEPTGSDAILNKGSESDDEDDAY